MPRYYDPRGMPYPAEADDPRERYGAKKGIKWGTWLKWIGIGIAAIVIILLVLSATGNLRRTSNLKNVTNATAIGEQSKIEQITTYILAQQKAGLSKEQIVQRLQLAGFDVDDIEIAYQLSDPVAQYILNSEKQGKTRQQIVEELLARGVTPDEIQKNYTLIESTRKTNLVDSLKKNWFWLLLGAAVIFFVIRNIRESQEEKRLMPKVFTLDECEEYAREYLTAKGKAFNPSKQYRNRPDIRQYRFVYEEPLYPEFNDHLPTGHKVGHRMYFLIAIGYDKEVIDYLETHDDNRIYPFLYGAPKGFEQSGAREYLGLRRTSEQPVEEQKRAEEESEYPGYGPYRNYPGPYRPPYTRIRPGPVTGFERE